jgi:hypothetical protein
MSIIAGSVLLAVNTSLGSDGRTKLQHFRDMGQA